MGGVALRRRSSLNSEAEGWPRRIVVIVKPETVAWHRPVGRLPVDKDEAKPYQANLKRHAADIIRAAQDPKTLAYQLADRIEKLLTDRGDDKEFAKP